MSWILAKGGYLIQCDRCGYLRGQMKYGFQHDGHKIVFTKKVKPKTWQNWKSAGPDAHLRPDCVSK